MKYRGGKIVQSDEWDPRESDPEMQMTRRYRYHLAPGKVDGHGGTMGYADTIAEAKARIDSAN